MLKLLLPQLSVCNSKRQLWDQFGEFSSGFLNGFDFIVEVVNLSPAQCLPEYRLFDQPHAMFSDKGLNR